MMVLINRLLPWPDTTGWVPYDGVYPLREEGWLMAPDTSEGYRATSPEAMQAVYDMAETAGTLDHHEDAAANKAAGVTEVWIADGNLHETVAGKPIDDLEDDAPDVPNDEVVEKTPPLENDDDS